MKVSNLSFKTRYVIPLLKRLKSTSIFECTSLTIKPTKILETKTDGKKREAINLPQCQLYYTVHNKGKCNKFTLMSCHKLDMAFQELNAYKDETLWSNWFETSW